MSFLHQKYFPKKAERERQKWLIRVQLLLPQLYRTLHKSILDMVHPSSIVIRPRPLQKLMVAHVNLLSTNQSHPPNYLSIAFSSMTTLHIEIRNKQYIFDIFQDNGPIVSKSHQGDTNISHYHATRNRVGFPNGHIVLNGFNTYSWWNRTTNEVKTIPTEPQEQSTFCVFNNYVFQISLKELTVSISILGDEKIICKLVFQFQSINDPWQLVPEPELDNAYTSTYNSNLLDFIMCNQRHHCPFRALVDPTGQQLVMVFGGGVNWEQSILNYVLVSIPWHLIP